MQEWYAKHLGLTDRGHGVMLLNDEKRKGPRKRRRNRLEAPCTARMHGGVAGGDCGLSADRNPQG
jgi:hypothetical protein